LIKCKSPGGDQILAEVTQAGETFWSMIHKFINSVWNTKKLPKNGGGEEKCI
jgi:hypothetical protein